MRNPNSFGGNSDSSEARETKEVNEADFLRASYHARGHEANKDFQEYQDLLKQKADLEAALGVSQDKSESAEFSPREESMEKSQESQPSPAEVAKKAKQNLAFKKKITAAAIGALALIGTSPVIANALSGGGPIGTTIKFQNPITKTEATTATEASGENSQYAGEMPNGLKYDYTEYADRENKVAYNAYGHNYSDQFNDREKATEGIMSMATAEPEALASYAYNVFTAEEKQELGISGLNMVEIDNKLSDASDGGAMQQKLLSKLDQVLKDKDTSFNFYYENDTEKTNYIYFVDDNKDGNYTPDELHLGYDTKKRTNAPQVDILRTIHTKDASGKEVHRTIKLLDLNMACGFQPNYEQAPVGVPYINADGQQQQVSIVFGGGSITNPDDPKKPDKPTPDKPDDPKPDPDDPDDPKPTPDDPDDPKPTPDDPDDPTPVPPKPDDPKPTPDNPHTPKDEEKERENAGNDVTPLPLDEKITPKTTVEDDRKNFDDIEEQRKKAAEAAEEARKVAEEQAKREEEARKIAETREVASESNEEQVRQADEAARKAEEQAAKDQAEAAERERAAAEEERAREEAQEKANEEAESHSQEAESHSDDTASERAASFENGDF